MGQTDLTKLWSGRIISYLIANASELHFGQEVLQGDLQGPYSNLGDMNTLTPKTKDDVEF
jgi:hypothetical protein